MAAVAVTVLYVMIDFTPPGSLQSRIKRYENQKNYTITPLHQGFTRRLAEFYYEIVNHNQPYPRSSFL
jgi:hypothetical protein